jgi:hypothetical protein
MRSVAKTKTRGSDLDKLKQLLGPPPVLASESLKDYNAILSGLMEAVKPDDFVLEILVTELADWTWEIKRYKRHKTLVVERKRLGQLRDQEDLIERIREGVAAKGEMDEAEKAHEDAVAAEHAAIRHMLAHPDELDQFDALKSGSPYYDQLDRMQARAIAERDNVLAQIEQYRQGLAQRARQVSDEIIEAEFQPTNDEVLSITGPGDGAS